MNEGPARRRAVAWFTAMAVACIRTAVEASVQAVPAAPAFTFPDFRSVFNNEMKVVAVACGPESTEQLRYWQEGLCYSALVKDDLRWDVVVVTDQPSVSWEPCVQNIPSIRIEAVSPSFLQPGDLRADSHACSHALLRLHTLVPQRIRDATVLVLEVGALLGGNPAQAARWLTHIQISADLVFGLAPRQRVEDGGGVAEFDAECGPVHAARALKMVADTAVAVVNLARYRAGFFSAHVQPRLGRRSPFCVLNEVVSAQPSAFLALPCEMNAQPAWNLTDCPCAQDIVFSGELACAVYNGRDRFFLDNPKHALASVLHTRAVLFRHWDPTLLARRTINPAPLRPLYSRDDLGWYLEVEGMRTGIEVGVQSGKNARKLLDSWPSSQSLVLIDLWKEQSRYEDIANVEDDEQTALYLETLVRLRDVSARIRVCRNFSVLCARELEAEGVQVDFAYIDARHDYEGVMEDLVHFYRLVRPGGILAGHDFVTQSDGPVQHGMDWTTGTTMTDGAGRAVRGAVMDFARTLNRQVVVTYREWRWNSWMLRK